MPFPMAIMEEQFAQLSEGITPGESKVSAIKNFKEPTNITEVRRFLGLTGFFRKFVQDYSTISKPITKLLRKDESFVLESSQQEAFQKLIEILCNKPVLTLYNFKAYHEVHTNASALGLAGVLLQSTDQKLWKPVCYFSRHTTDVETKYHSYEFEVLAVVESLTRFHIYILGKPFRLVTDCSAIATVKAKKELLPRISRWWMKILEFDFEITHRAGNRLAHVDGLSRSSDQIANEVEPDGIVLNIADYTDDWILTMQLQDPSLLLIIDVLNGKSKSDQEKQFQTDYKLQNNRLYRKTPNGLRLVIPKAIRWRITQHCHDEMGHFGTEKTIERILKRLK